jgi:carbon-monoxide dehydrogenase medium subunit
MKPAPFDYYAPATVAEALQTLNDLGYSGKVLAGGQSLIPAMNFRMAQPQSLVDVTNLKELDFIRLDADGSLRIGAITRDTVVENHPLVKERASLICEAMPHIAHPAIRNRGTFGGAMAHADPAGQLPCVSLALGMRFLIRSVNGERWVDADDFYQGPFTTVIDINELLAEVAIPAPLPNSGTCYRQVSRQQGSQVQVGVAVSVGLDDRGLCKDAKIAVLGVAERTLLAKEAARQLIGKPPSQEAIHAASTVVSTREIDPGTDIHATQEYREHVTMVLTQRALTEAFNRARGEKRS